MRLRRPGDSAATNLDLVRLAEQAAAGHAIWAAALVPDETRRKLREETRFANAAAVMTLALGVDIGPGLRAALQADVATPADAQGLAAKVQQTLRDAKRNAQVLMLGLGPYLDGVTARASGHTFELQRVRQVQNDRVKAIKADVVLDGGRAYAPAITTYLRQGTDVPTPSVRTGVRGDVYLTLERGATPGANEATIRVFIKPLIVWLWIGGALMAIGTLLAAFPGKRRRRPTDPVSAPIATAGSPPELVEAGT